MIKEMKAFNNSEFGQVRTIVLDNEPWLIGKDVAEALGYKDPNQAIRKNVDTDDRLTRLIDGLGQKRNMVLINESGLYALILSSKLSTAKKFKKWVTSEVLPSIRKHGAYMTDDVIEQALADPDMIIGLATKLKESRQQLKMKDQIIGELKSKTDYLDQILQSKDLVKITAIAKDYGMSGQAMNKKLHEMKIQYKGGDQWFLYSKYHSEGYTHSETVRFKRSDGRPDTKMNTKWTQKGRLFLYEELKKIGVLPVIERGE